MSDVAATPCLLCGAADVGGRPGCQTRFDALAARSLADARYAGVYRAAFDAYCMQHPEDYGVSARSYAAHLLGLCCATELDRRADAYRAIPHWLSGLKAPKRSERYACRVGADRVCAMRHSLQPENRKHPLRRRVTESRRRIAV